MLIDIDYYIKNQESIPRAWRKSGNIVTCEELAFRPYFLVRELPESIGDPAVLNVEKVGRIIVEKPESFYKITVKSTGDIVRFRDIGEHNILEHTIPFHSRVLVDRLETPYLGPEKLTIVALDIEMFSGKGSPTVRWAETVPIDLVNLAWRIPDGMLQTEVLERDSRGETDLIRRTIAKLLELEPDVIVGYNSSRFDWPYFIERCKHLQIRPCLGRDGTPVTMHRKFVEPVCAGRHLIDLLPVAQRELTQVPDAPKHKTLKNVADYYGALQIKDREMIKGDDLAKMWKTDKARVLRYAHDDARATLLLGEAFVTMLLPIARKARARLTEMAHAKRGRQVEHAIVARAVEQGRLIPDIEHRDDEHYEGAFVFDPPTGLRENIRVVDVTGMYPTIMETHNTSAESFCKDNTCKQQHYTVQDLGHRFHKEPMGFIPALIKEWREERKPLKKQLTELKRGTPEYNVIDAEQSALKVLANASYGIHSWSASRYYFRPVAESVTAYGRHYITKTIAMSQARNLEVLSSDTDSIFYTDHPAIQEVIAEAQKLFPIVFEDEGVYPVGLFLGRKKRYALLRKDGSMKVRGLEMRRGEWCKLARETQETLLELILKNRNADAAVKHIQNVISDFRAGKWTLEDVTIWRTMDITKKTAHATAAHQLVDDETRLELQGTKVGYVVVQVDGANTLTERIRFVDSLPTGWKLDVDYYVQKQIVTPSMRILEIFTYQGRPICEELLTERAQQSKLKEWI